MKAAKRNAKMETCFFSKWGSYKSKCQSDPVRERPTEIWDDLIRGNFIDSENSIQLQYYFVDIIRSLHMLSFEVINQLPNFK